MRGFTSQQKEDLILSPFDLTGGKTPRYYQQIAINNVISAIVEDQKRILLTMATGTGKTTTAFQICWKLWQQRWNLKGDSRRPKILYLSDRKILVDDPMNKEFAAFGEARHRIAFMAKLSKAGASTLHCINLSLPGRIILASIVNMQRTSST